MNRRTFVKTAAAAAASFPWAAFATDPSAPRIRVRPFGLKNVRLRPGLLLDAANVNRRYMMTVDPDRLLHMFRVTAGLPSNAKPLGGWEQPANELRGHMTGHHLSACALSGAGGDDSLRERGASIVSELAKCQKAHGNGYLSAFPEEFFDRLRGGQRVWAPFYTLHKIMAGLLDTYTLSGNAQALDVLKGIAEWTRRFVDPLGDAHMGRVLEIEYGGMNEVLYNLAAATGDRGYQRLAHRFDHERIFAPLAEGRDELKGLHVNTQIPKIIGAARRYELLGERRYRNVAEYFWNEVVSKRSYCTGGTSNGERWGSDPGKLASELGGYTQECCCTYNMLKLTRQVFSWTADPRAFDYYERALWNGILGTQHPEDGMTLYYVALGTGYWKLFGLPFDAFWCCTGSGLESFSKLGDSIYFHDDEGVFVNLFVASDLDWPEKGVRIEQATRFPEEEKTTLTIRSQKPTKMSLRIRVPYWVSRGTAALNGRPLEAFAAPSSYFLLDRVWQDGDTVEVRLPMSLHVDAMPDDESLQAFMYGPLVLVGRLGARGLTKELLRAEPTGLREVPRYKAEPIPGPSLKATSSDPSAWIHAIPGRPLEFQTSGHDENVTLVPFYKLLDERYGVYWKVTGA